MARHKQADMFSDQVVPRLDEIIHRLDVMSQRPVLGAVREALEDNDVDGALRMIDVATGRVLEASLEKALGDVSDALDDTTLNECIIELIAVIQALLAGSGTHEQAERAMTRARQVLGEVT